MFKISVDIEYTLKREACWSGPSTVLDGGDLRVLMLALIHFFYGIEQVT